jgi:hypothetical protein
MIRTTLASLGIVAMLLPVPVMIPPPASAQVSINIDIGIGTNLSGRRRISCARGAELLRNRGFRDVRSINCRGRYFVYRAARRGNRFEIALSSRNGEVVDLRRLGRRR